MPRKHTHRRRSRHLLDIWSVSHFFFGTIVAMFALVFAVPIIYTLSITLLLALLWEKMERKMKLHETRENSAIDVLLALVGCLFTVVFILDTSIPREHFTDLLVVSILVYTGMTWFSWEARLNHEPGFLS